MKTKIFILLVLIMSVFVSGCTTTPNDELQSTGDATTLELLETVVESNVLEELTMPEAPVSDFTFEQMDDGNYSITGYTGSLTEFMLPSEYKNKYITSISNRAFKENPDIVGIIIPKNIVSVGASAFENCINLKEVIMLDKDDDATIVFEEFEDEEFLMDTRMIGRAFANCTSLSSVVLPYGLSSIPAETFTGCTDLKEVVISESISFIGMGAFQKCYSLETITIPESVVSVFELAFFECTSLTTVEITDSTIINPNSFYETPFRNEQMSSTGFFIVNDILYDVKENESVVTIPHGVKVIYGNSFDGGYGAFSNNTTVEKVVISNSVNVIGDFAFAYCTNLKNVDIINPSQLEHIGNFAFLNCVSLEGVVFPDSLISIGNSSFGNCPELRKVYFPLNLERIGSGAFARSYNIFLDYYLADASEEQYMQTMDLIKSVCEDEEDYLILTGQYVQPIYEISTEQPPNPYDGKWSGGGTANKGGWYPYSIDISGTEGNFYVSGMISGGIEINYKNNTLSLTQLIWGVTCYTWDFKFTDDNTLRLYNGKSVPGYKVTVSELVPKEFTLKR